jgi:hypothetical protein
MVDAEGGTEQTQRVALPHFLVIVRRDRPEVLEPLRQEFAASTGALVVLDRRARPRTPDKADPCWLFGFKVAGSSGRSAGLGLAAPASTPVPSSPSCLRCSGPIEPGRALIAHHGATLHLKCWSRELRNQATQQCVRAARERDRSIAAIAAARGAAARARQTAEERPPC